MTDSDKVPRWPAGQPVWCSGCGAEFGRNDQDWIVHPEPWCEAMMRGEERPTTERPDSAEWKTWPGFARYEASHRGTIRNRRTGRVLATTPDPDGRRRLNLYADDGTRPNLSVARCVLTAHDRAPEPGEEACHGGAPDDDRWPEKIRWDTKEGNERDKIAAGTTPKPNPTYPCKDGCGQLVISEGRRCLDCIRRVGQEAAAMLGRGVNLYDVAEHFGYTTPDWVWKLATEYGGCTLTKREALTQQPSFSQRVTARLVTLSARRGWRSDGGDAT